MQGHTVRARRQGGCVACLWGRREGSNARARVATPPLHAAAAARRRPPTHPPPQEPTCLATQTTGVLAIALLPGGGVTANVTRPTAVSPVLAGEGYVPIAAGGQNVVAAAGAGARNAQMCGRGASKHHYIHYSDTINFNA